jgi:Dual specificity phosphatase, catalytic domain
LTDVGVEHDHAGMKADDVVTYDYPAESCTEVIPGLFQASAEQSPAEMLAMFDVLIDVGGRDRWDGDPDPRYRFHPIDDVPFIVDAEMIHTVGERIAALVREGKHVAVNCLSGVNRSGLLVARALVELGYTPEEAIEAVRTARGPMALSNQHFVRFLLVDCTPRALARRRQLSLPL